MDKAEMQRILDKLDVIAKDMGEIKVEVAKNSKDLEYHILRTGQNENLIHALDKRITPLEHVNYGWKGSLKLISTFSIVIGILLGAIELIKHI